MPDLQAIGEVLARSFAGDDGTRIDDEDGDAPPPVAA